MNESMEEQEQRRVNMTKLWMVKAYELFDVDSEIVSVQIISRHKKTRSFIVNTQVLTDDKMSELRVYENPIGEK